MSISIKDKTFIICSIVRNAEKGLKVNIPVINAFCKEVHDFQIVIFENNSTDGTKALLTDWIKQDATRIHCIMEDKDASATIPKSSVVNVNPFYSRQRIEKMVRLRNQYMEYVVTNQLKADYLIVVDLDVARLDLKGIISSFQTDTEWDAITAFGYSTSPKLRRRYHDTYALTEYGDERNPQTEEKIKSLAEKYGKHSGRSSLIRVFSAFGGLAIYKYAAVYGLKYQVENNADKRVEVRCEHFSIYRQMKERGNNKVYINTKMTLKYQNLTYGIVWNSLIRKLNAILTSSPKSLSGGGGVKWFKV